jgi:hypothetical protein
MAFGPIGGQGQRTTVESAATPPPPRRLTMVGTAPPTVRELIAELRDVLRDVPLFLTAPLYRRWHLTWGATPAEVTSLLPGDGLMPHAQYRSTRAISIDAPPAAVWPWLVQVGCLRAGWYSNDLLDNLARPSATTILPGLQGLVVGQWVPMSPTPSDRSALKVHSFAVDRWLVWTTPDSTWAWQLIPLDRKGTRLIARITARYDWRHPLFAALGVILMEFGDFPMLRRMLRGIKTRAESAEQDPAAWVGARAPVGGAP